MRIPTITIALFLVCSTASAKELVGKVVKVADGDTVTALADGQKHLFVSAETIDFSNLVERNHRLYKKFTNVPFTGRTSGQRQATYKDGGVHGPFVAYHENGQLKGKAIYRESITSLHRKSGTTNKVAYFRHLLKRIAKNDHVLEYAMSIDAVSDMVSFRKMLSNAAK
jgi:hypothetical protein